MAYNGGCFVSSNVWFTTQSPSLLSLELQPESRPRGDIKSAQITRRHTTWQCNLYWDQDRPTDDTNGIYLDRLNAPTPFYHSAQYYSSTPFYSTHQNSKRRSPTHPPTTRSQQVSDTSRKMAITPTTPTCTTSSASTLTYSFLRKHGLLSTHKTVRNSSKRAQRRAQGLKKGTRETPWHRIGQYFKPTAAKTKEQRKAHQDAERRREGDRLK